MNYRKTALIELGGSHSECIYSQLLFLKNKKFKTSLILDQKVDTLIDYEEMYEAKKVYNTNISPILLAFKVWKYIITNNFSLVIFNTAQGSITKYICILPFPSKISFIGTLHNLRKTQGSIGHNIIARKCNKLFTLSDFLIDNISTNKSSYRAYYPVFFPKYTIDTSVIKKTGEIWITVPGGIFFERKPYMDFISKLKIENSNLRFLFLGIGNKKQLNQLKSIIEEQSLSKYFIFWDQFISNSTFHTYINLSDYILPLVDTEFNNEMYKTRITGAFNLAYAYKKTMILHSSFKTYMEFNNNTIFYNYTSINSILANLANSSNYINNDFLSLEYQSKRYTEFIPIK
ncbi:hypothetical protein EI427_15160 [Flammeovirga pectinis]|uniref:Glycosyltransferase family 1 protein n=1 Tax=Flammeovirga pectinis TaxID=2494373 RepID=A0A3Q9FMG1_9BACT|nr:hypothetical protein [Flammeovirga pectinis]AZQ63512.1 hypothetical protein EI427_15160 [Flammeovirga pectinis]